MSSKTTQFRPYIVGVGASAGGLEALEGFFKHFPEDTGMSFVVVQHLSPDFKSLMVELLARYTKMKIHRVDKPIKVQPNSIYLIAPKKNLTIKGMTLTPSDQDPSIQPRLPIDSFFTSLAEEFGRYAVGVVLSGTGSDGTKGAARIKENEGLVLVQDPEECKFDGMPKSAIKNNIVDKILKAEEMHTVILQYATNQQDHSHSLLEDPNFNDEKEEEEEENTAQDREDGLTKDTTSFRSVTSLLQSVEGIDFSSYRSSTIGRRIERRIKHHGLKSLSAYIDLLRSSHEELIYLHSEMLINVTRFFRDQGSFGYLEKHIIPEVVDLAKDDPVIRVWSAGCSTGEEAYSIAICLDKYLQQIGNDKKFKIFATDVDKEALEIARSALYSEKAVEELPSSIVEDYFTSKELSYEVKATIRTSVVFSQHDVSQDPPFTKVHFISCRNLLIYFQPSLQARALSLFHFGLRQNGFLFLGKSETLGSLGEEFTTIHSTHKVFQKIRDVKLPLISQHGVPSKIPAQSQLFSATLANQKPRVSNDIASIVFKERRVNQMYEKLLNEFVPPCLLIDENLSLIHAFGDSNRILEVPKGKVTFNVTSMLDKDLSVALNSALNGAKRFSKSVSLKGVKSEKYLDSEFEVIVRPFVTSMGTSSQSYIAIFQENQKSKKTKKDIIPLQIGNVESTEEIKNLEEQLQVMKESLQTTIEELETTNEELQSTNEELMSSNEELQSSNEELQSVNEELYTVNTEHQDKIDELLEANSDIDFLLESSSISMVFLDEDLKIRRYNESAQDIINIMTQDVGRKITDITFNFSQQDIIKSIKEVAQSGNSSRAEYTHEGAIYLTKVVPYTPIQDVNFQKGKRNHAKFGIVLSFVDVSSMREAQELKRLTEESNEFNYIVSHDLRKPIRKMHQTYEDLQIAVSGNKKALPLVQKSQDTLNFLSGMLDRLLQYSRVRTHGNLFTSFDPSEVINEILNDLGIEDYSEVHLTGKRIYGDKKQITEVFKGLLTNSVRFGSQNTRELKVKINEGKKKGYITFSIEDNGPGMLPEISEKVFDIFQSLRINGEKSFQGSSLALCKRIIDRHGGSIEVDQSYSDGTKIVFSLAELGSPII